MKSFKLFFEQLNSTAVISYGRYNPPTIGHQKLIDKIKEIGLNNNAKSFIVPSHSQDSNKNPLTLDEKTEILKYMSDGIEILSSGKTLISLLQDLQNQGYKKIIQVAGSDRLPDFKALVEKYNGKPDSKGIIPFSFESYDFVSSGERDPDSEGIEGMSASKVRSFALEGDIESFKKGLSNKLDDSMKEKIYEIIRERIK